MKIRSKSESDNFFKWWNKHHSNVKVYSQRTPYWSTLGYWKNSEFVQLSSTTILGNTYINEEEYREYEDQGRQE